MGGLGTAGCGGNGLLWVVSVPWVGHGCYRGSGCHGGAGAGLCWVSPSWGAIEGQGDPGDPRSPPAEFSIWTREAGAGGLSIAVEGPSKAEISFEDRKDGSCGVSYLVQEPGEGGLYPNTPNHP